MAEKRRIEVTCDPKGYTLFTIGSENVVAFQRVAGTYHIIPREREALSTRSGCEASDHLLKILRAEGGDVVEFCARTDFLFPLGE